MTDQDPTQPFATPPAGEPAAPPPAPTPASTPPAPPAPPAPTPAAADVVADRRALAAAPPPTPPRGARAAARARRRPGAHADLPPAGAGGSRRGDRARRRGSRRPSAAARSSGSSRSSSSPWSPARRRPARSLLTGASGTPSVLAWAPADSVTYTEVRLDLPGNQQAELAKVAQRVPGVRRPGRLPDQDQRGPRPARRQGLRRQAELHGRHPAVVRRPAQREHRAGALGHRRVAGARPRCSPASRTRPRPAPGRRARSRSPARPRPPRPTTASRSRSSSRRPTSAAMAKDVQPAYAVTGPVLALGDLASVKAAIDTGGKTGLNTNAQFQTASATITGDRLAFAYVDTAAIVDAAERDGARRRRHAGRRPARRSSTTSTPRGWPAPSWPRTARSWSRRASPTSSKLGAARQQRVDDPVARPGRHDRAARRPRRRRGAQAPQGDARLGPVAHGRRQAGRRRAPAHRRLRCRGRLDRRDRHRGHGDRRLGRPAGS